MAKAVRAYGVDERIFGIGIYVLHELLEQKRERTASQSVCIIIVSLADV
jgi:hypothetical protein